MNKKEDKFLGKPTSRFTNRYYKLKKTCLMDSSMKLSVILPDHQSILQK